MVYRDTSLDKLRINQGGVHTLPRHCSSLFETPTKLLEPETATVCVDKI